MDNFHYNDVVTIMFYNIKKRDCLLRQSLRKC